MLARSCSRWCFAMMLAAATVMSVASARWQAVRSLLLQPHSVQSSAWKRAALMLGASMVARRGSVAWAVLASRRRLAMSSRSRPLSVRVRSATALSISRGVAMRMACQVRSAIFCARTVRSRAGTVFESRTFQRLKARRSVSLATTTATTSGPSTHPRPASSTPARYCGFMSRW